MTYEDECREYVAKLEEKAKTLVGTWVRDKPGEDYESVYFVTDYYVSESLSDVILTALYIPRSDRVCPIIETDIYMSEFSEYYRTCPASKGKKIWLKMRELMDDLFLGPGAKE